MASEGRRRHRWVLRAIYLAPKTHALIADAEGLWNRGRDFLACGQEPRRKGAIYLYRGEVACLRCLRWLNRVGLPHSLGEAPSAEPEPRGSPPGR